MHGRPAKRGPRSLRTTFVILVACGLLILQVLVALARHNLAPTPLFPAAANPANNGVLVPGCCGWDGDLLLLDALQLGAALCIAVFAACIGLKPFRQLESVLQRHQATDSPLPPALWPAELRQVIAAFNRLHQAQADVVAREQAFLADASHQLRTPVAVLKTLAQSALLGHAAPDATLRRMIDVIDRTTALTNQLLSLAKTRQLVRRGVKDDVALDAVARQVAVELAPLMAQKCLDFSFQATAANVRSDTWMVTELVKNLLANAIKHSPDGTRIGIDIRTLRGQPELIVWDHGGGVESEVLDRLFEPFTVASGSSGIGLGLSICRQIAESMDASVRLFNRLETGEIVGVDAVVRWHDSSGPNQEPAND